MATSVANGTTTHPDLTGTYLETVELVFQLAEMLGIPREELAERTRRRLEQPPGE